MKKTKKIALATVFAVATIMSVVVFSSFRKTSASTVTITNKFWNSMHLQVREGNQSNPEANPMVFDGILPRDQSFSRQFPVLLFYRRDANPDHPDGRFTNWTECFTSENIDNP
ncbi:MAG TPA: hypothetical protein VHA52_08145 [Candidatus Babeliaceae bacterium]|nr:hypothetical protein [Candidatus Babeliaceae bacterium]